MFFNKTEYLKDALIFICSHYAYKVKTLKPNGRDSDSG